MWANTLSSFVVLALPVACIGVQAIVQVLLARYWIRSSWMKSVFLAFGIGLTFLIGLQFLLFQKNPPGFEDLWGLLITNLLVYGCLWFCYFNYLNIGEASVRIRVLLEVERAGGAMNILEIEKKYNSDEIIDARIGRLISRGEVVEMDGRFYLKGRKMLRITQAFRLLKFVVFGKNVPIQSFHEI